MPSMFQITDDVKMLSDLLAQLEDEEWTDSDVIAELSNFLVEAEDLLADKVDGYVSFYRNLQARAKARREEARHMTGLAQADERRMDRLKVAVRMATDLLERAKLKGHTRSITVSQTKRPAVDITDTDALPDDFKEQVVSWRVDKKAIAKHIMSTGEIPAGVETRRVIRVSFR